jgi:hypothetical protein
MLSSIIYQIPTEVGISISWHGSRNCDFDLIQFEGERYVLAGVCWRPQEWILKCVFLPLMEEMKF